VCFYYDDICSIWVESRPKARKGHKCVECGGTIVAGEVYHKVNFVFDGSAGTYKECDRCESVRNRVAEIEREHGCHGGEEWCPFGNLAEAISEADDAYGFLVRDPDWDEPKVRLAASHLFPDLEVVPIAEAST
jgi:hypothetical protein